MIKFRTFDNLYLNNPSNTVINLLNNDNVNLELNNNYSNLANGMPTFTSAGILNKNLNLYSFKNKLVRTSSVLCSNKITKPLTILSCDDTINNNINLSSLNHDDSILISCPTYCKDSNEKRILKGLKSYKSLGNNDEG